jgi:hypothetical protein
MASNLLNVQQSTANVIVVPRLRFTITPPKNITLKYGSTLRLPCQATSGSFQPQVAWTRENATQGRFNVLTNGTLVIDQVETRDSGVYVCTAKNIVAQITTRVFVNVTIPLTCSHARQHGHSQSGFITIAPDGSNGDPPFRVYCDMQDKNQVGVTVISHDSEQRTLVQGCEPAGCYSR